MSKRVGKAHVRNRVRRLLREAVRPCLSALQPGYDVVLISKPALAGQPFAAVQEAVCRQLQRARLVATAPAQ